mmetsp:Transcript_4318/g.8703  ORF Transcript_4318/g.8703 Transcript_4318/m.8703 type:complete len:454 (+) Transcript_4318:127-1488(+)|eukprot:CAMPEP_0181337688 /NCGR_PEP_ID=MMETSP1101-20121128/28168_1 /TAXON_ID=46948 /ORGANISM="Rhodomonas abbreviata, Strain Caron Lab Isolate" /LENGTH=453 /DNA_ID=CAMNT_0023448231 /DNA_START=120 /DNA_END=1481 /DNA_ORIENTATION=+
MAALPDSLKYSKWDHIEVSDDEGDSHPNIDQKLMARLKKEKRARDYEEFRKLHPDAPDPIRAEELKTSTNRTVVNSSSKETEGQKEAKRCKETGNKHFGKGEYLEAEEWFGKAIDLSSPDATGTEAKKQLAVYYNNRAAARSNLNKPKEAIEDATAAIKLDFRYVKARLCRAKVYETEGDTKAAYDDYKRAMSYEPNNAQARSGVDRLQGAVDKLAEEKLIEITIPDVIPDNRVIKYNVPGHGEIELELPDDAQPGQTIKLQMEEEGEQEPEEEGEGGGGLHRHADLYQKSLDTFFKDPVFNQVFMDRWFKMAEEGRMAVIDRTFDAMVQQTITNTSGYKMSKSDLYLLCPEIAPERRREMAKKPDEFIETCKASIADTDAKAKQWLESQQEVLANTQIAFGMRLQFQISVNTDGGIEVMAPIRRLLVAETLVCVFEALTGKKAAEMEHMANM